MAALSKLFQILWWAWIATELLLILITRTSRSSGTTRDRGSLLLLWPVIFGSIWLATWFAAAHPHSPGLTAHWIAPVSLALLAIGLLLRWTAILTLGSAFSVNVAIHATQTLHRSGLFRLVRHPSYSAMLIIFLAVGLHCRNWLSLAFMLVPTTAALLYRIQVEEQALTNAFGDDYRDYIRTTKRLIPGLY